MAVFDADAKLTARTARFEREFPKRYLPNLEEAVARLLRSEWHRRTIHLDDQRVVLVHLRGDSACVVATTFPDILGRLSPRQQEIAHLAIDGATSVEIAQILDISVHTVRQHIKEVYRRLQVGNRAELVQIVAAS